MFGGPGYKDNGRSLSRGRRSSATARGRRATLGREDEQGVNRFILSSNVNWRPVTWMQTRANVGTDLTDRVDIPALNGEGAPINATYRLGFAYNGRTNIRT